MGNVLIGVCVAIIALETVFLTLIGQLGAASIIVHLFVAAELVKHLKN